MQIIIDVTTENPQLILKQGRKIINQHTWFGILDLAEKLLPAIDQFLCANKIKLTDIKKFRVKTSPKFLTTSNIAKTTATILNWR